MQRDPKRSKDYSTNSTLKIQANMAKFEDGAVPYEVYPTILVLDFG